MIRKATANDIQALESLLFQVQAIHAKGRPDIFKLNAKKYSREELTALIDRPETPVFVYEKDDRVCGYAFCIYQTTQESEQLHQRKTLYIDDLCVDENARGNNIGRKLYEYVRSVAKASCCDSVTLNVWSLNESARKFYEKMNMKQLKTTMEDIL